MQFTFNTTDARLLAGITAARNAYNQAQLDAKTPGFVPLATDQDYIQFVMNSAAQSYANQYKVV